MRILSKNGRPELAQVYVAEMRGSPDYLVEFVDACDQNIGDRRKKWVIVVSCQFGCPVNCLMCDAGGYYRGNLTVEEMMEQVEQVVAGHAIRPADCSKFKVQFARMGEPALNEEVLRALELLHKRFPNVLPCIATIAPEGSQKWFEKLLDLRDRFNNFQLQFSLNTTDAKLRDRLMLFPKLSWDWMAGYGERFIRPGQRKPVLNFALCPDWPVEAEVVKEVFSPEVFAIKLTVLNPTETGRKNGLAPIERYEQAKEEVCRKASEFVAFNYEVIRSVGNMEENEFGSNCGQAIRKMKTQSHLGSNSQSP